MSRSAGRKKSQNVTLVTDIYSVIVDWVASDESPDFVLHHLSLTCRLLRPLCQQHLFSDIKMDYRQSYLPGRAASGPIRAASFLEMLQTSPQLAGYVKTMQFTFHDNSVNISLACDFLSKFHRLHGFHLLSAGSGTYRRTWNRRVANSVDWESVDPQLRRALITCIHTPGLQTLGLSYFTNFPLKEFYTIGNSGSIRNLFIGNLRLKEAPDNCPLTPPNSKQNVPSKLAAVRIDPFAEQAVRMLLGRKEANPDNGPAIDFTRVRDLSVICTNPLESESVGLFLRTSTQIESLELNAEWPSGLYVIGVADDILCGSCKTLNTLRLSVTGPPPEVGDDHFGGMIESLERLSDDVPNLKSLIITLNTVAIWCSHESMKVRYQALDKIFSKPTAFRSLRQFSLTVFVAASTTGLYDDDQSDLDNERLIMDYANKVEMTIETNAENLRTTAFPNITARNDLDFVLSMECGWVA